MPMSDAVGHRVQPICGCTHVLGKYFYFYFFKIRCSQEKNRISAWEWKSGEIKKIYKRKTK